MVYPVFSVDSIAERCKKDVDDFLKQEGMTDYNPRFQLVTIPFASKADLERAIKPVKEFIETNLPSTYVQSISKVEDLSLQRELWIARTYLFYQLMIFVVAILGNSQLYTEVFGEPDNKTVFPYREDRNRKLSNGDFRQQNADIRYRCRSSIHGNITKRSTRTRLHDIGIRERFSQVHRKVVIRLRY